MSIRAHIENDLTDSQRKEILDTLQYQSVTTQKWVYPYLVHDDSIYLPYAYARQSLKLLPPPRSEYPEMDCTKFEGTLRAYQQEVKTESLALLNRQGSCVLSLHVGWGKSIFAIYLATRLRFKTLILVNRLVLVKQWTDLISSVCPLSVFQFLKTGKTIDPCADYVLVNATNVSKFDLGTFSSFGTVIADEIHLICAHSLYKSLFYLTPRYLVGLSATPTRPDGLDYLIRQYFGSTSITKRLFRHHDVYAIHTGLEIDYDLNWEGRIDWNSLLNNQAEHTERNALIVNLIRSYPKRCFLVLCKRIAQGKRLVTMLENENEHVTHLLSNKHNFDTDARIVIATAQKCGVGFSVEKLDTLLLASDVEEYFIQYLGRVFRTPHTHPLVFDLVDSNGILNRHFSTRKRVYKKSGGMVHEVTDVVSFLEKNNNSNK